MALETIDDVYQFINKMPKGERLRVAVKILNDVVAEPPAEAALAPKPQDGETAAKRAELPEWVKFAREMAKKIEEMGIELPSDLAEQHDHYLYGTPKR